MVLKSRYDAQQQEKDEWLRCRLDALNFYRGRSREYITPFFSRETLAKVEPWSINITRRVIDRISLVYMISPERTATNEKYEEYLHQKSFFMQKAERMANLLELVLIHPCYRNGRVEYDLITDFEPTFSDHDPLTPIAFEYPLATRSSVRDSSPEWWAYWSEDEHFIYDKNNSKKHYNPDNPDNVNPYGVLPFIPVFKNGIPDTHYLDTDACSDLVSTNLNLNIMATDRQANIRFQSFGYIYVTGEVDNKYLEVAPDKITKLQLDSTMGVVTPPDTAQSIDECIRTSYKMLAQNYHLSTSFVDGGEQASSGISLRIRNQELNDSRKASLERWRNVEYELFDLERIILSVHAGVDVGQLEVIDFSESMEVLSDEEQREKDDWDLANGLIDKVDILVRRNPDWSREDAEAYLEERNQGNQESPFLKALQSE
jgi:hypothetical protein